MTAAAAHAAGAPEALAGRPAWLLILGLAVVYVVAARLGLLLAIPGSHLTPVWPPSGIALAALLLCGRRVWPGIFVGSLAAKLWDSVGGPMGLATDVATAAAVGAGASLAALLGAALLARFVGPRGPLERVRDVGVFLALGGAVSCVVSATVGVTVLCWSGVAPWTDFGAVWLSLWLGDTAGVFVVAPLLLAWRVAAVPLRWSGRLELAACLGVMTVATAYVFVEHTLPLSGRPLAFAIVPCLVWPAVRFGQRGAALAIALIAATAAWATVHGFGPFSVGTRNEPLLMLALFLGVVALTALCIAAIVSGRERAEAAQRRAFVVLEERLRERTEQLVENQRHCVDLFELAPDALVMADGQGTIMQVNRHAEALFGWSRVDLVGQSIEVLMPASLRAGHVGLREGFMTSDGARAMGAGPSKLRGLHKDGTAFPVDLSLGTLQAGRERVVLAAVRDTSERHRAESELRAAAAVFEQRIAERTAELRLARDAAEQAGSAKSAFLAAMSHAIRTPMHGLVGMIDVLEHSRLRGSQQEIVATIRDSALALLAIVDNVLDFSKIEAGVFQIDHEPVDVAAMVEGVCDTLVHQASAHGVRLRVFVDPALPPQLRGDAMRLRQVLLNLVGNAIKFSSVSKRVGQVSVRAAIVVPDAQPAALEFSVADNGIGIEAPKLARLFTPFTQADASSTRRFGGSGLGLSISQRLVQLMGGTITVDSAPGQGSTFRVRVPLLAHTPAPASAAPELPAESAADAAGFTVRGLPCLVLGDAQGAADDLAAYLAHAGARVQRAPDGAALPAWLGGCGAEPCVCVVVDAGTGLDVVLAGQVPGVAFGLLVVDPGVPAERGPGVIGLDGNLLRRGMFLRAVGRAAGRTPT